MVGSNYRHVNLLSYYQLKGFLEKFVFDLSSLSESAQSSHADSSYMKQCEGAINMKMGKGRVFL